MREDERKVETPTILRWMSGLVHPVESFGDYFERLEHSVKSSAPPCTSCG